MLDGRNKNLNQQLRNITSRVYLFLDVFPMISLIETHLNYLSTLSYYTKFFYIVKSRP